MTAPSYDRSIASDGLTIDTDRGPVDTVALDRVRRGFRTTITRAEAIAINTDLTYNTEAVHLLAAGLGISPDSVLRRVDRERKHRPVPPP